MAKLAAIDLGSNALRLRIVEADVPAATVDGRCESVTFKDVHSLRVPVRLGNEVFLTGKLAASGIGQACDALREFRRALDSAKVEAYRAVATSAVREASNGHMLVERARREAGIELEVVEGIEEARLVQIAVSKRLPLQGSRAILFDVGGGSTEFTLVDNGEAVLSVSLPLGSVRLLETYVSDALGKSNGIVDRKKARLLDEQIVRTLNELSREFTRLPIDYLIGTGGNVETLAELCPAGANGTKPSAGMVTRGIDVASMKQLALKMNAMTSEERRTQLRLRPDRADTIVPASRIFACVAERFQQSRIVAPGVGLKEGLLLELAEKHFHLFDPESAVRSVLGSCLRLGHRYGFDEAHGSLVERFSSVLFDATRGVHGLGDRDRLLLRAAAVLHDIGDFVRYDGHHKHSYYLISHSDVMGLSSAEREIVANVARYHRKSAPDLAHGNFERLGKEARVRVRVLAGLLRIADALDREHLGKVETLHASVDLARQKLCLTLGGEQERDLEEWSVREKSELLRDVLALEVELNGRTPTPDAPRVDVLGGT